MPREREEGEPGVRGEVLDHLQTRLPRRPSNVPRLKRYLPVPLDDTLEDDEELTDSAFLVVETVDFKTLAAHLRNVPHTGRGPEGPLPQHVEDEKRTRPEVLA